MSAQTFTVNERVLCYHGPLIYEAKVLKTETWDASNTQSGVVGPHYYVHYKGWKQTWDEWVDASRLLKFNETNIGLQKALQSQSQAAQAASASSSKAAKAQSGKDVAGASGRGGLGGRKDGARGTKRGRDEDEGTRKPEMKLNVPETLKVLLVDDWEAVTKNNQLVGLPRKPSTIDVLEDFKQHVLAQGASTQLKDPKILLPTIIAGLQTYFDRALGANLLYRFERPQYAEIRKKYVTGPTVVVGQEKEMSAIYGAEHFLRMLVSLPQMVASSSMDGESVGLLREYVNELLQWMADEKARIFAPEYESASIAYQNISRS
ncbi:MRG-domain-containing protein [Trametes versicolor FP-101664 SS1]|uniref:MRG-domain-containing protein n=1 Tax=Trametes versicolor (strain FP-101664) TaxID=717944 RepID=UPI0004624102|nr:MRG-domain-containing protein [Trametes versicolor FP-101664 SS1]EIW52852.1 MRG-domain-containing protein [Trametes versicolor FP-101664 SS1]